MQMPPIVFHILGIMSIVLAALPLSPFAGEGLVPVVIPHQTIACIAGAAVIGIFSGRKGSVFGWVGLALGAISLLVTIVALLMTTTGGGL